MKKLLIVIMVLLLGAGAFYFLAGNFKKTQPAKPLQKIVVQLPWLHQMTFGGMYVAKEKGFYKEAGLDVELKGFEQNLDNVGEVVNKKADFTIITPIRTIDA